MFWDSVIVIEEMADFHDCLYMGGAMSWSQMLRSKMKRDVDFSMRIRRIRRAWYHFTEDTADNIMGFVCLLMAMAVCAAALYLYGTATWFR